MRLVIKNVNKASPNVTAIFPVTFIPNGDNPKDIQKPHKKEDGEQIAHISSIMFFSNVGDGNVVANIDDNWLKETTNTSSNTAICFVGVCQAAKQKEHQSSSEQHGNHTFGHRQVQRFVVGYFFVSIIRDGSVRIGAINFSMIKLVILRSNFVYRFAMLEFA